MSALRRSFIALSVSALVAGSLSACTSAPANPQPAANALAQALTSGDFSAVTFAADDTKSATTDYETAFAELDKIPHTSTVSNIAQDEQETDGVITATGTIHTVWDIDDTDNDLSYDTTAVWEYDQENETWKLRYDPEILAPDLTSGDYLATTTQRPERGDIVSASGRKIVTNRKVVNVGIDKTHVDEDQWASSAQRLAKLVDIDEDAYVAKVKAAGDKAWVVAITLRDDSSREVSDEKLLAIPGVVVQPDEIPLAPTRSFARPILGSVGEATAEIIEKSKGKVKAGDQVGLSGLQAAYNDTLAGTDGVTISRYNAQHEVEEELFSSKPHNGEDLEITLDPKLQRHADELIEDAEINSAIVVIRPSDGAVLAASSGPVDTGLNLALQGQFAPGSSFKIISALAMVRDGAKATSEVNCMPTTEVDGKSFKNFDHYPADKLGKITLGQAIAQSCNTVFINESKELGAKKVAEAANSLGLVAEDGTGAGALFGSVPDDSTGTELAANMIGQGVIQASPLGMATVVASVQAGHTVQPQLVLDPKQDKPAAPTKQLKESEAKELRAMMKQTIQNGTLVDLKGVGKGTIIGKSGTAEYDSERNAHAWAVAAQGDIAVAAFVEDGIGGAQTAGPLVKEMLKAAQ